jgi:hypothetical protein
MQGGGILVESVRRFLTAVADDRQRREEFAVRLVTRACELDPKARVVAVSTGHRITGDYMHVHAELYYALGTSQGYEIYIVGSKQRATFALLGDGGFMNWAYKGRNIRRDGKELEFE